MIDETEIEKRRARIAACEVCGGKGWVCENHPDKAWPEGCDCGAGMPCVCNSNDEDNPPDVTGVFDSVVAVRGKSVN